MASSSAAAPTSEVPYNKPELKALKKASLVSLVARQAEKWPGPDVYTAKSTSVPRLRAVLLDPRYGFTKSVAISSAESRSVSPLTPSDEDVTPPPNQDEVSENPLVPNVDIQSSQEVLLGIVEDTGEEWRAELNDILCELQNSNSAITGPVKLSYRDSEVPDYWVAFVKVTDDALLEEAQTFPKLVSIQGPTNSKSLQKTIYFHAPPPLAGSSISLPDARELFDVNDPAAKPLEHARRRTRKAQSSADLDADWLKEQLKNTPGYQDFKRNQHRGRKKIQKKASKMRSMLGSTAYSEGHQGYRHSRSIWGRWENPAQSVIDRVNSREDPPKGAKELYPFLIDWDKEHK
ncbi:hypothetical protein B0H11DRAFT_1937537 [Mycena galericulata]|nr:hypothetical protein B0H11DRAFT_1937537 [Mycena galericulata]